MPTDHLVRSIVAAETELNALVLSKDTYLAEYRERALPLRRKLDKLKAEKAAQAKLDRMTDEEKKVMLEALKANESSEEESNDEESE